MAGGAAVRLLESRGAGAAATAATAPAGVAAASAAAAAAEAAAAAAAAAADGVAAAAAAASASAAAAAAAAAAGSAASCFLRKSARKRRSLAALTKLRMSVIEGERERAWWNQPHGTWRGEGGRVRASRTAPGEG